GAAVDDLGEAAAVAMAVERDRPVGRRLVLVGPGAQGHQDRVEVEPLLGEAVLLARPDGVAVGLAPEYAGVDEPAEAVGEQRARDAERGLEVLEAPDAQERLPEDEERPALAHERDRARDVAGLLG